MPPTFALSTSAVNDRNQSARGRRESATRGSSIVNSTCAQLANSTCVQLARGTLGGTLLRAKRSCAPGLVKVGRWSDDQTCQRGRAGHSRRLLNRQNLFCCWRHAESFAHPKNGSDCVGFQRDLRCTQTTSTTKTDPVDARKTGPPSRSQAFSGLQAYHSNKLTTARLARPST